MRTNKNFWIQKVVTPKSRGLLHRQLKISLSRKIPKNLLVKIKRAKVNSYVRRRVNNQEFPLKVTRLLKRRAVLALNLERMKRKSF